MTRPSAYADARDRMTRSLVLRALEKHNNNVTHAAAALGVTRTYVYKIIKRYDIPLRTPPR